MTGGDPGALFRASHAVAAAVDLADVRLAGIQAQLHNPAPELSLTYDLSKDITWHSGDRVLMYQVASRLEVLEVPSEAAATPMESNTELSMPTSPVFSAQATFVLTYVAGDGDWAGEALDAFGETSVAFTIFPYIRELFHGLTSRAGLTGLVLPTLRGAVPLPTKDHPPESAAVQQD